MDFIKTDFASERANNTWYKDCEKELKSLDKYLTRYNSPYKLIRYTDGSYNMMTFNNPFVQNVLIPNDGVTDLLNSEFDTDYKMGSFDIVVLYIYQDILRYFTDYWSCIKDIQNGVHSIDFIKENFKKTINLGIELGVLSDKKAYFIKKFFDICAMDKENFIEIYK